jgi:hypothetical protein
MHMKCQQMQMRNKIFFNGYFQGHCDPLMVLKRVHSQALKPDSLQTLMHRLTSFTIELENTHMHTCMHMHLYACPDAYMHECSHPRTHAHIPHHRGPEG